MKISHDKLQPLNEKEITYLSKDPFFEKIRILSSVLAFFLSFAGFVLLLIGGMKTNTILLIVGGSLLFVGLIFIVFCFLGKNRNKKVRERVSYQIMEVGLGTHDIKTLPYDNLDKHILINNHILNQYITSFYTNCYSYNYKEHEINLYNVKSSSLMNRSSNDLIAKAMKINSSDIGNDNKRTNLGVEFCGSIFVINSLNFKKSYDIREIKDSINSTILFKDKNKINVEDEFDQKFDVYGEDYNLEFLKSLISPLDKLSQGKLGVMLIINKTQAFILLYNYYFNLDTFASVNNILKLGIKYQESTNILIPIKEIEDILIDESGK